MTPELAARLRRGEQVSPEEIAASTAQYEAERTAAAAVAASTSSGLSARGVVEEVNEVQADMSGYSTAGRKRVGGEKEKEKEKGVLPPGVDSEWIPESHLAPRKKGKGKGKRK